ncbi:proteinase inhibitor [Pyrus ussuriensis x Pyrus communis]|uniref:Proteinase inhibitor n=1 Tax=Pyrus ussuriensis x Pyrus communis TaxID=2448454 RepID=A0A5N5GTE6_9ROSA|nr:proteinase inhibitor [Pyrus ussuriensis x Pyrus communis]
MLLGDDGVVENGVRVLLVDEARADVVGKVDGVENDKSVRGYPEEAGGLRRNDYGVVCIYIGTTSEGHTHHTSANQNQKMSTWPRYPPCANNGCTNPACCGRGHQTDWPELLGKPLSKAKAVIQKTIVVKKSGIIGVEVCCNRVYVFIDESGNVSRVPFVR